jgi:hypothetical protein
MVDNSMQYTLMFVLKNYKKAQGHLTGSKLSIYSPKKELLSDDLSGGRDG